MAERKHSRKRDAILECVRTTDSHPTAEWVYAQLKPQIPDLSLGTVYRNLTMFKQEGIIASVGDVNGTEHFDGNCAPHAHFVCTHCNRVLDLFDLVPPDNWYDQITCGNVSGYSIMFHGICKDCIYVTDV